MSKMTLAETRFESAVRAAVRAPSLHNSQPWRFRERDGAFEVLADESRRPPVTDPRGWGMRLAGGAAAFNARLALAVAGQATEPQLRPDPDDPDLLVRLVPVGTRPATPAEIKLFEAIPHRHSNRCPFFPTEVPAQVRVAILEAARAENAWLELMSGAGPLAAVSEIANAAARSLDRNAGYQAELRAWTRTDDLSGDGVPVTAGGPSPEPQDLLPNRAFSDRPRAPGRDFEPEPLVAVLGTAGNAPNDHLVAGMALQRVLLTLTAAKLAASLLSQPIEVTSAREQLRIALRRSGPPQMVLRIGYGQPAFPTPRRPISEVIVH